MNHLKISTRLYLLIGTLSLLLAGIGAMGLYGNAQANQGLKSVYEDRTVPLKQLSDINYLINRNRILVTDMLLSMLSTGSTSAIQVHRTELNANNKSITQTWQSYKATQMDSTEVGLADKFEKQAKLYLEAVAFTSKATGEGDVDEGAKIYRERVSPQAPAVQKAVDALMDLQTSLAQQEFEQASSRYTVLQTLSIAAIALGVLLSACMGWMLVRGISRSLATALRLSEAVARGDLRTQMHIEGNDEVAQVLRSLQGMQESLTQMVRRVRQGAESVSTASSEITHGNQDLSARTERQASALEETAASMEELGSTVHQNAEHAQQANRLAQTASEVAIHGGKVVGDVVTTMRGISASSNQIADIINVIDGIAFQTNILALNAAVEAARAGEQGRGFAVVAGEVRNLASRSAEAAKQIKALITESVQRVEQGGTLADAAGTTMEEVVAGIRRVTDIMAEISAASQEQNSGVAQISTAVTEMDQVTQQNAALVEQMTAAASSLQVQATDLVTAVSVFQLVSDEGLPPRAPQATAQRALPANPQPRERQPAGGPAPRQAPLPTPAAAPKPPAAPSPVRTQASAESHGDWQSF